MSQPSPNSVSPRVAGMFPGLSFPSPGEQRMEAGKDQQVVFGDGCYPGDGTIHHLLPSHGVPSVDEVGITAGDRATPCRIRTAPNSAGHAGPGKTEGAGGQKWSRALRT